MAGAASALVGSFLAGLSGSTLGQRLQTRCRKEGAHGLGCEGRTRQWAPCQVRYLVVLRFQVLVLSRQELAMGFALVWLEAAHIVAH